MIAIPFLGKEGTLMDRARYRGCGMRKSIAVSSKATGEADHDEWDISMMCMLELRSFDVQAT
jgi:hypothetical protein